MLNQIEVSLGLIVASAFTILFAILAGLFIYQTKTKNRRAHILTLGILFGVLAGVLTAAAELVTGDISSLVLRLELIAWGCSYVFIYLFFEQLERTYPDPIRLSMIIFFFGSFLIFSWLTLSLSQNIIIITWDFFYNALGVAVFSFGTYSFLKVYAKTYERIPLLQGIGTVFVISGFILSFLGDLISLNYIQLELDLGMIPDAIKIVGLLFFVVSYIYNIDYLYRLPVKVISVAIYSSSGLPIYIAKVKEQFEEEDREDIDQLLLGGMFSALNDIIKKATGSFKDIQKLANADRTVSFYITDKLAIATTAEHSTHFLERAMQLLANLIEEEYSYRLEDIIDIKKFPNLKQLVEAAFPFLKFKELDIDQSPIG